MKICRSCHLELPLSDFYKHKQMADGHLNKCKKCVKKRVGLHRENNLEKIREYDRNRGCRFKDGYTKEYRKKYPNKYKAHTMVNNATRDKRLFKEDCSRCGSNYSVHAHHDDYLKPLNVRWLCAVCHKQWHEKHGEATNP